MTRVLITIDPPEQQWDRCGDTYSTIGEVEAWHQRADKLSALVGSSELAASEPGSTSHYTHRGHLAESTVEGVAVRALCGVFFVPTQDHRDMPVCPGCGDRFAELPT